MKTEERCEHFDLCDYAGAGCSKKSSKEACGLGIEIRELATKRPCPALAGAHCEIPDYVVLMKKGEPCGEPGKCFLCETLKGLIPAQDFVSTGKIPDSYKKPRAKKKILRRILLECSMI